jgi:hypothetical protein
MRACVVADGMAARSDFSRNSGDWWHPRANQEESRFGVVDDTRHWDSAAHLIAWPPVGESSGFQGSCWQTVVPKMVSSAAEQTASRKELPQLVRWAALVWIAVWFPAYWHAWGLANFLHLCDLAVIVTCIGLWTGNRLLLSSQAISSLLVDLVWAIDAAWKIVVKHHLIGGTEYLFDAHVAMWIRLLSLFHVVLPPLLLWVLWRTGYDRRAWSLQSAIALVVFVASRFTNPATNINFAYRDPFWHRSWGPGPVHVAASVLFMAMVVYLPTHQLLCRLYRPSRAGTSHQSWS